MPICGYDAIFSRYPGQMTHAAGLSETFEDRVRRLSDPEHNAALDHAKRVYNTAQEKFNVGDPVNHPDHYTQGDVECIDAIESALGAQGFIDFLRGQVIKYAWRMRHKGDALENGRKGAWYQSRLVGALTMAADDA